MIKNKILLLLSSILIIARADAWEPYDKIIAVVNDKAIIESDVERRFDTLISKKRIPRHRYSHERSKILDKLIEDAIVIQTAEEKSIIVSNKKITNQLKNSLNMYLINSGMSAPEIEKTSPKLLESLEHHMDEEKPLPNKKRDKLLMGYIKYLEKKSNADFEDIIYEMRVNLQRQQVMSIAIGVSPPSKEEAKKWYWRHRSQMGYEANVKHILIRPKKRSLSAEREASQKLASIRKRVLKGESFEKLARKYSEDPGSKASGGNLGWVMLAQLDPYFAGNVARMSDYGQISKVFKSSFGYHIVKFLGKRPVSYENVEQMIMYKLYNEKVHEQYEKWVKRKKKVSEIKIFMNNYVSK